VPIHKLVHTPATDAGATGHTGREARAQHAVAPRLLDAVDVIPKKAVRDELKAHTAT
jgi:hypothetical protein